MLAIPIILSVNLPAFSITRNNPSLFWLAVGITSLYVVGSFISYLLLTRKRAFAKPGSLFYTGK
jgi:ESS family glutamate:Na+ symporter